MPSGYHQQKQAKKNDYLIYEKNEFHFFLSNICTHISPIRTGIEANFFVFIVESCDEMVEKRASYFPEVSHSIFGDIESALFLFHEHVDKVIKQVDHGELELRFVKEENEARKQINRKAVAFNCLFVEPYSLARAFFLSDSQNGFV